MGRALVHLNLWLLGALLVVGLPLVTVGIQALVRRLYPSIVEGQHNDVAGFLIAVVGVVYAVTLAFIVIVTWEQFREARDRVDTEAGSIRSLYRDSRSLPEPSRTQLGQLSIRYAETVAGDEWKAMDDGHRSEAVFGLISDMFSTLGGVTTTTPTQETFMADALVRLNQVAQDRASRITQAEEGQVSILWAAIILGGIVTVGFALLFGVSDQKIHFVMVGCFAAVLAVQILVILVLSFPFSGDVKVTPAPFERVVQDFGG
jgi:hypothetical protein